MPGIVSFKGFVEAEKAACPEIADEDIKEPGVFQGFSEPIKKSRIWFVSKKC